MQHPCEHKRIALADEAFHCVATAHIEQAEVRLRVERDAGIGKFVNAFVLVLSALIGDTPML